MAYCKLCVWLLLRWKMRKRKQQPTKSREKQRGTVTLSLQMRLLAYSDLLLWVAVTVHATLSWVACRYSEAPPDARPRPMVSFRVHETVLLWCNSCQVQCKPGTVPPGAAIGPSGHLCSRLIASVSAGNHSGSRLAGFNEGAADASHRFMAGCASGSPSAMSQSS